MTQQQETSSPKAKKIRLVIIAAIALAALAFGIQKIRFALTHETTDNAQVETQITPVLPRISGYVKKLTIKDYDSVKAGDLLAEIDDAELQAQLAEMKADYIQAETDIVNAKAALQNAIVSLKVNEGTIAINDVKLQKALADANRDKKLFAAEAITKKQLDETNFQYQTAAKQLDNSKNDLLSAQSKVTVLAAGVKKAEAALAVKKARINQQMLKISYTKIYAPQSGKIGRKTVSENQFVQAGTPIFSVVNDSTYWVVANIKESQLYAFPAGKKVTIHLDAYPTLKLEGIVNSQSDATGARFALLPPDNSSGNFVKVTQRVPVKIWIQGLNSCKQLLKAGLSASLETSTN